MIKHFYEHFVLNNGHTLRHLELLSDIKKYTRGKYYYFFLPAREIPSP